MKDTFKLKFDFPIDYPNSLPLVTETGGKIDPSFHHYTSGGLCLCATTEQYMVFSKDPTLKNYIENLVNPYLVSWLWYKRFGVMPWGERVHGPQGLFDSYKELLKIDDPYRVLPFLQKIVYNAINQREDCPCGSGISFRHCHKKIINRLLLHIPHELIASDFTNLIRRV